MPEFETRLWRIEDAAVFRAVRARWGVFSNFHTCPLVVGELCFGSSEALYQALRYPEWPDLQRGIAAQPSPKAAKLLARSHLRKTRTDWDAVKIDAMRWVLRVKLSQTPAFVQALARSAGMEVVEHSAVDAFWGATPTDRADVLRGRNALGRLLVEVRDQPAAETLEPPLGAVLAGIPVGILPGGRAIAPAIADLFGPSLLADGIGTEARSS